MKATNDCMTSRQQMYEKLKRLMDDNLFFEVLEEVSKEKAIKTWEKGNKKLSKAYQKLAAIAYAIRYWN